ncbi:Helicase associated domain protein [Embleya sp. NPDC050493]|uniref:DEAD/DEAH box helicase n=1 Tax=Embleya sp. NPDC050493 TaxID=3363989 RepID=UPI00379E48E7
MPDFAPRPRPHQIEAVDAAVRGLEGPVRPGGNRGLLVSATGTGKTLIAAETARRLAPAGGTLILVPTLDLLTQTVTAWRTLGHDEPMLAVCSLEGDTALGAAGVRATTSGPSLALWARQHARYTVFGTYASLGAVIHAHTGPYGIPALPVWRLVLCDEAHRAAGHVDKSWTDIHDNTLVPAQRRLYMTATPRIYEPFKGRRRRRRGERRGGLGVGAGGQGALFEVGSGGGGHGVGGGVEHHVEPHTGPHIELPPLPDDIAFDVDPEDEYFSPEMQTETIDGIGEMSTSSDRSSGDGGGASPVRVARLPRVPALPEELAVSMDAIDIYGPRVFHLGLAESIQRGLLARFVVLVTDIRDKELNQARRDARKALDEKSPKAPKLVEAWRGKRLAALQTALLKTARENGLRTVITFHHRVAEAKAFALGLPSVGRRLRAELPDQAPTDVRAEWLHGDHPAEHRRRVLGRFAEPGVPGDLSVVANVRILGEGIDCPAVDAVAILDEMSSIVSITQALGRALRQRPGQGKTAAIVVPVFLDDHEHADDMLLSDGHRHLVTVLSALRAHAPEMVEALAVPQARAHGTARAITEDGAGRDEDGAAVVGTRDGNGALGAAAGEAAVGGPGGGPGAGGTGDGADAAAGGGGGVGIGVGVGGSVGGEGTAGVGAGVDAGGVARGPGGVVAGVAGSVGGDGPEVEARPLLRFSSPRDPAVVADFVRLRVIDPDERDWVRGYLAARRFLRSEGHMRIPLDARDEHDHEYPVGQWAAVQRREYAAGRLDAGRVRKLVMLGMVWNHPDAAFDDGLAIARRWAQRHGHLAAPQGAVQDGVRVGQWLANQRRSGVLDNHPEREAALRELDAWWRPDGWTIAWQRAANEVRLYLARGGSLDELAPGHIAGGEDIGRWAQRHATPAVWGKLRAGQIEQLRELGIAPEPGAAVFEGGAVGGDGVEGGVAVGAGVGGVEGRGEEAGGGVGVEEGGAVVGGDGAGAAPAPRRGRSAWETAFGAAVAYRQREGHLEVPRAHVETVAVKTAAGPEDGAGEGGGAVEVRLGKWVNNQRTRRGSLSEERERLLTELGMRW